MFSANSIIGFLQAFRSSSPLLMCTCKGWEGHILGPHQLDVFVYVSLRAETGARSSLQQNATTSVATDL